MAVIIGLLQLPGLVFFSLGAVIGKQSQIHFKSSFDLVNLKGCQLVMDSERCTAEATSTLFGVRLMLLTWCRLYAECGFGESLC